MDWITLVPGCHRPRIPGRYRPVEAASPQHWPGRRAVYLLVIFGEKPPLHHLDEDMQHLDMQFLHAVRILSARRADADVGQGFQGRTGTSSQRDDGHAERFGRLGSLHNIDALAAGAQREQAITLPPVAFDITRKNVVVTEIVRHAADM